MFIKSLKSKKKKLALISLNNLINSFEQITFLKNRISLLESENRLLKDNIANKLKATFWTAIRDILRLIFFRSSAVLVLDKKVKQRIKDIPPIKDGAPVL